MSTKDQVQDAAHRYAAVPYTGWRSRLTDYTPLIGTENQDQLERIRDIVYGIVLDTGADLKTLCDYFGWDRGTARSQIGPVVEMAKAELKLAVQKNQLDFAFTTKQPLAKIHAGRQFADQTESGAVVSDTGQATEGIFNGLTVIETHRDPSTGQTIKEPTQLRVVKAG